MRHKWCDEIIAWANGETIEYRALGVEKYEWDVDENPAWCSDLFEFRIKPQPPSPKYLYVYADEGGINLSQYKSLFNNGVPLIGKIKLEVDDE